MTIETNWRHCTYCGETELIIGKKDKFCPYCGHYLEIKNKKKVKRRNKICQK